MLLREIRTKSNNSKTLSDLSKPPFAYEHCLSQSRPLQGPVPRWLFCVRIGTITSVISFGCQQSSRTLYLGLDLRQPIPPPRWWFLKPKRLQNLDKTVFCAGSLPIESRHPTSAKTHVGNVTGCHPGRKEVSRWISQIHCAQATKHAPPWLWKTGQTSPEVQNNSSPTKRTCVFQKKFFFLNRMMFCFYLY